MNENMQTLLSGAVVSAILWLGLSGFSSAHADTTTTNQPPGYGQTSTIGTQISAGESSLSAWQKTAVGELADYDSYAPQVETDDFVNAIVNKCIPPVGPNPYAATGKKCLFEAGNGLSLLISSLLGQRAFDDPDPTNPINRNLAVNYVQNMTFSTPNYPGDNKVFQNKDKKDKLTDDGYSYFATIFRQLPMVSVAQNAMLGLVGDRTRLGGMSTGFPGVGANNAASILEMLHHEALRRFGLKSWYDSMNVATDQAVMREIAYMMAFQNYMLVKTYEQNANIQALLVAQVSTMTNITGQVATSSSPTTTKEINKQTKKNQ